MVGESVTKKYIHFFPFPLLQIAPRRDEAGVGPVFDLPRLYDGAEVAQHFHNACELPYEAPLRSASRKWLDKNNFNSVIPPPVLYSWWKSGFNVKNFFARLSYDVLHCFFIGLLAYFMEIVLLIIHNKSGTTELGYRAAGEFDERIGAMPALDEGFRLFRNYAQGVGSRSICSGSDRFYLLRSFNFAIGLDAQIIPDPDTRAVVQSACEAALVLSHLLHAEALTPSARDATYHAARRLLKKLRLPAFLSRQKSRFEILKYRMLQWIVNKLTDGAPTSTNTSKFEAALRILVSRILKRASGNKDCLADVANHYIMRATFDRLRSAGGPVADELARAAIIPARRRLLKRCDDLNGEAALSVRTSAPALGLAAIQADWSSVPGNAGPVPGSDVDFGRATFFERAWLARNEERFAAFVDVRTVVSLDPLSSRFEGQADFAAPEDIRDDPARVKLARVIALFYLPPPPAGGDSDGFPVAVDSAVVDPNRMFALVHPFAEQGAGDRTRVEGLGLKFHAVRVPVAPQQQPGAAANVPRPPPWIVFPLRQVLRAMHVGPATWPVFDAHHAGNLMTVHEARRNAGACRAGAVLVFIPPTRGTYWPTSRCSPVAELRAAEEDEEEEDGVGRREG